MVPLLVHSCSDSLQMLRLGNGEAVVLETPENAL